MGLGEYDQRANIRYGDSQPSTTSRCIYLTYHFLLKKMPFWCNTDFLLEDCFLGIYIHIYMLISNVSDNVQQLEPRQWHLRQSTFCTTKHDQAASKPTC